MREAEGSGMGQTLPASKYPRAMVVKGWRDCSMGSTLELGRMEIFGPPQTYRNWGWGLGI